MLFSILQDQNLTAQEAVINFLIVLLVIVFSLTIHEFAHAFAATKMGDDTARVYGRLSLNPFKHIDLIGFASFIFLGIGWAKPVPINPIKFKKYKTGIRLVSIAGILANLLLAILALIINIILIHTVGFEVQAMGYVYTILHYIMLTNSALALFNFIPLFPLDGFNFISSFCKTENKFIKFNLKNSYKILMAVLLSSFFIELLFNFDILGWYLSLIYNYILLPLSFLGV